MRIGVGSSRDHGECGREHGEGEHVRGSMGVGSMQRGSMGMGVGTTSAKCQKKLWALSKLSRLNSHISLVVIQDVCLGNIFIN
jgi:hypothetical protein